MKEHTECRFTISLIPKLGSTLSSKLHALSTLSQKKERQYPLKRSLGWATGPVGTIWRSGENSLGSAGNRTPVGPFHSDYTNWTILALIRNVELKL